MKPSYLAWNVYSWRFLIKKLGRFAIKKVTTNITYPLLHHAYYNLKMHDILYVSSKIQVVSPNINCGMYLQFGSFIYCEFNFPFSYPLPLQFINILLCFSFVQEFVADPLDGITLLLELLRAIQLSQSSNAAGGAGSVNTVGKIPPSVQKRALLDELSCLQCLLSCCTRYSDSVRKLPTSSAGLYTLAVCIMSNVNKARTLALQVRGIGQPRYPKTFCIRVFYNRKFLQLLTKACDPLGNGHSAVSEAMSTLRLRFGEPVRFRFLVGMLMSAGGQGELLAAGMQFLNTFLETSGSAQRRLYIQAELEQAGFDIAVVKKVSTR